MKSRSWDIFCSVVDNFGDIGVCWRLARRLSSELGQHVRLWVDDLGSFQRLCPGIDVGKSVQSVGGVEVRHWTKVFPDVEPADIVVEGFGVRLPEIFTEAMAARRPPPVWINLEYLSAEAWVDDHHGLPSPHPCLPLRKYFFFPGFTRSTGGVLIEQDLLAERNAFQSDTGAGRAFLQTLGINDDRRDALRVSLFCYENAALPGLVAAWKVDLRGVHCIVPEGHALTQLEHIAGRSISAGSSARIGHLIVHAIPFLSLDQYDRLLWSCDVNFVRGEDSFVRAQLAARPLIWQAYPQDAGAHLDKVAAFWMRYAAGLNKPVAQACARLFEGWNRQTADCGAAWPGYRQGLETGTAHAQDWAGQLAENGDLAANLAKFCEDRLE
jgi:uncharacterized repeat protein (TIGR03837 family)